MGTAKKGDRLDNEIRIVNGITFECNTTITSVILGIDVRGDGGMRQAFPSLQIWRPNTDDQVYELIEGSERPVVYTPSNVSRTGVYEYPLIPPIDVRAGDRIAISQPEQKQSFVRHYFIEDIAFESYKIPFGLTTYGLSGNDLVSNHLVLIYPVTGT